MKHISPIESAGEASVKMPTRRTLAKQQTRAKVLAAARKLFSEQGYEGATIRDIAGAAGMSTGAVFANFTDKSDLFREIIFTDMAALIVIQREAAQEAQAVEEALIKAFSAGYSFYKSQMHLARAAFGISWTVDEGQILRSAAPMVVQLELFEELLRDGVRRGELTDTQIELRAQMLFDAYLSNFAQAIFAGLTLDALLARSADQIAILLAGARRG